MKSGNFLCRDIAAVPDWSLEQVLRQNFYNHAKALLVVLFPIFNYSGCLFNQSFDNLLFSKNRRYYNIAWGCCRTAVEPLFYDRIDKIQSGPGYLSSPSIGVETKFWLPVVVIIFPRIGLKKYIKIEGKDCCGSFFVIAKMLFPSGFEEVMQKRLVANATKNFHIF